MSHTVRRLLGVSGTALVTTALAVSSVGATTAAGTAWTAGGPRVASIVIARAGHVADAAAAVRAAGGRVGTALPIVDGFKASVSSAAAATLNRSAAVVSITPDSSLKAASDSYDPTLPGASAPATSKATSAWAAGDRGAGVTVAVLDTGVAGSVPDLAGRVTAGPDFSGEGNSLLDSYGHGTVMAGIIAGNGSASDGAYPGIAPEAHIVSVKVAGRNGASDVSTVLAGLQWIGSYAAQHNIKVVSLAWGTPSHQSTLVDPLDFAVERLWSMGITVVVSAGNTGPGPMTISKPGDDPAVITVGAFMDAGTVSSADDTPASWSGQGPTAEGVSKPDLIAPGRTLIAVRSPGSAVEQDNPQALVGDTYIRGSGTSQATAVTAGGAALLLSAHPNLTPDQVKYAVTSTASSLPGVDKTQQGKGELRISRALNANPANAPHQDLQATGIGSLEGSRGGQHVWTHCPGESTPTEVVGDMDAICQAFSSDSWSSDSWSSDSWSSDSWSSDSWSSDSWSSDSWSSDSWSSDSWSSDSWSSHTWDAARASQ